MSPAYGRRCGTLACSTSGSRPQPLSTAFTDRPTVDDGLVPPWLLCTRSTTMEWLLTAHISPPAVQHCSAGCGGDRRWRGEEAETHKKQTGGYDTEVLRRDICPHLRCCPTADATQWHDTSHGPKWCDLVKRREPLRTPLRSQSRATKSLPAWWQWRFSIAGVLSTPAAKVQWRCARRPAYRSLDLSIGTYQRSNLPQHTTCLNNRYCTQLPPSPREGGEEVPPSPLLMSITGKRLRKKSLPVAMTVFPHTLNGLAKVGASPFCAVPISLVPVLQQDSLSTVGQ